MKVDQYGWDDIPNKKPDPHDLALVARGYGMRVTEAKRLRAHFWRDQLHYYLEARKKKGGQ